MIDLKHGRLARLIHWLFEASLLIKGTLTALESLAGLLLFTRNAAFLRFVDWLVRNEIALDQDDPVATGVQKAAEQLALRSEHFYALYLIGHGGLKLAMVLCLAGRFLWAYPLSMVLLAGFASYEFWEFWTQGSLTLLLLAALDLFMIWLVWREYLMLRAQPA